MRERLRGSNPVRSALPCSSNARTSPLIGEDVWFNSHARCLLAYSVTVALMTLNHSV